MLRAAWSSRRAGKKNGRRGDGQKGVHRSPPGEGGTLESSLIPLLQNERNFIRWVAISRDHGVTIGEGDARTQFTGLRGMIRKTDQ